MRQCYCPCHKLGLSLQEMFCQPGQPGAANTVVYLKDVPAAHLELLLTFCYRGQVEVAQTELPSFLHTAAGLQVRGLSGEPGQEPVQGAGLGAGQENHLVSPQRRKQTRVAAPPPQSGEERAGQETGQVAIKQENEEELEPVQPVAQHLLASKQEEGGGEELPDDLSDYSSNMMFEEENNSIEAFTMPEPAVGILNVT